MRSIGTIKVRVIAEEAGPGGPKLRGGPVHPLRHAESLIKGNISVIPVKTDGSNGPAIPWKTYQEERMTAEEAEKDVLQPPRRGRPGK